VRSLLRLRLRGQFHDLLGDTLMLGRRTATAGLVLQQRLDAAFHEALTPSGRGAAIAPQPPGNLKILQALGRGEHDPRRSATRTCVLRLLASRPSVCVCSSVSSTVGATRIQAVLHDCHRCDRIIIGCMAYAARLLTMITRRQSFIVCAQATVSAKPADGTFDDPSFSQTTNLCRSGRLTISITRPKACLAQSTNWPA
jgi:hypothetical protein